MAIFYETSKVITIKIYLTMWLFYFFNTKMVKSIALVDNYSVYCSL